MTRINIFKDADGCYTGFRCEGHAEYADEGSDIVCSAVSAVTIGCCNAIEKLTQDVMTVESEGGKGLLAVDFPDGLSHDGSLLMDAMSLTLRDIANEYSSYIEFHIEEV